MIFYLLYDKPSPLAQGENVAGMEITTHMTNEPQLSMEHFKTTHPNLRPHKWKPEKVWAGLTQRLCSSHRWNSQGREETGAQRPRLAHNSLTSCYVTLAKWHQFSEPQFVKNEIHRYPTNAESVAYLEFKQSMKPAKVLSLERNIFKKEIEIVPQGMRNTYLLKRKGKWMRGSKIAFR